MANSYQVLVGDCIESMRKLQDKSVNCCVTSPPYFGLRDYGVAGQIGLEDTPEFYISVMVEVFREVKRVLRDDGTLWLNIGDSYATRGANGWQGKNGDRADRAQPERPVKGKLSAGIKPKDLLGIPWMLAFALRTDGWYLRQDIIWAKPNAMPESMQDRCTKAHEYIFLLSKSEKYHFDHVSLKEPVRSTKGPAVAFRGGGSYTGGNSFNNHAEKERETRGNLPNETGLRNRRSVWDVATCPYKGAHFATFPPALVEPCILAGCPVDGVVLDPFGGSGTTAGVAVGLGRNAILCEINPDYTGLIMERVATIVEAYPSAQRTVFVTIFDPQTKQPTKASVPSGFASLDDVVSLMGPPILRRKRTATYAGIFYSDYSITG